MNQKKSWIVFMTLLAIVVFLGSCATTAPEVEEPIVEAPVNEEPIVEESTVEETVTPEVDDAFVLEALAKVKAAKEDAIRVKAPKAASVEFEEGEKNYSLGLEEYSKGNLTEAVEFYGVAEKAYRKSIITANEQKEIALAALANAEAAIAKTETNAENAIASGLEEDQ